MLQNLAQDSRDSSRGIGLEAASPPAAELPVIVPARRAADRDKRTLEKIDVALASTRLVTPLPASLRAPYFSGQLEERRAHNRHVILIMIIIFDLFLLAQYKTAPDIVRMSSLLRFCAVTPMAVLFVSLDRANKLGRRLYGPLLVATAALPTAVSAILTWATSVHNTTATADVAAIPLILLATGVVARLTPREVYWNVALSVICFFTGTILAPSVPASQLPTLLLTDTGIAAAAIVFNLRLETVARRVFLMRSADAILRADLVLRNRAILAQSQLDDVTNAASRASFDQALTDAWRSAADRGRPVSMIMMKVDHFAALTQALGQPQADQYLRLIARAVRGEMRVTDVFARYGGETFAALLPGAPVEIAIAIAERMRAALASLDTHGAAAQPGLSTASFGAACLSPASAADAQRLVELAEANLHTAERTGRGRVVARSDITAALGGKNLA